jgi:hypothetical protein
MSSRNSQLAAASDRSPACGGDARQRHQDRPDPEQPDLDNLRVGARHAAPSPLSTTSESDDEPSAAGRRLLLRRIVVRPVELCSGVRIVFRALPIAAFRASVVRLEVPLHGRHVADRHFEVGAGQTGKNRKGAVQVGLREVDFV